MRAMRIARRILATTAAVAVSGAGILVAEILVARNGPAGPPAPTAPVNASAGPPGSPVATVVWLGDSTAAGLGASSQAGILPEQTATLLGEPIRLTDLGHSGDRVSDVLHTQLPRVAAARPDVVFISVGANDVTHLTARGAFRRDYASLLAGLPASVHTIVMLGVPDMGSSWRLAQPLRTVAGWRGQALDTDVRHLAARTHKAVYVDIAGRTGPPFRQDPPRYFASDHYHPNDAGYGLWAQAVAETMRESGLTLARAATGQPAPTVG